MLRHRRPVWLLLGALLIAVAAWNIQPVRARILGWANLDPQAYDRLSEMVSKVALARSGPGPVRVPLDASTVRQIFDLRDQHQQFDPQCYFHARPDLELEQPWPEHPRKQFRIRTNSIGLRSDVELATERADLQVLILGDSHVAGLCSNSESLPGQLQRKLERSSRKMSIEVVNASNAAYSFYHYLGAWERMRDLGVTPDVTVQVVYGGNDFLGGAYLWHFFNGVPRPQYGRTERAEKEKATERYPAAMGQVLHSVNYFRRTGNPGIERAINIGLEATLELERQCAEVDSTLVVVYLPAPTELPQKADLEQVDRAAEMLGIVQADLDVLGTIGDLFLLQLEERGIATLDLRPVFRSAEGPLYWERDLHLNLTGHQLAAQALVAWTRAYLRSRTVAQER